MWRSSWPPRGLDGSRGPELEDLLLPIRDIHPRVRLPVVNYALVILTAVVFVLECGAADVEGLIREYGFVPAELREAYETGAGLLRPVSTIFTSLFLHRGWLHVLGNLVYLHVFGDIIEERFGHLAYLGFYLAAGAAGALLHLTLSGQDTIPVIGASGAIAGVLGAYIVLYPTGRVVTLFPVFIFLTFVELPALLFPWLWAAQQLLYGYLVLAGLPENAGIAWFAHIGGCALGIAGGLLYRVVRRLRHGV